MFLKQTFIYSKTTFVTVNLEINRTGMDCSPKIQKQLLLLLIMLEKIVKK